MKRILLSILLTSFSFIFSDAATIKWDGEGGDGLWSTATNWVGDNEPVAGDDVILDNSVVAGTYIVNLPAGLVDVVISSLTITPSGSNNIKLILPATNTSATAFRATGTGDAVVLNNGAIFINSSGASGTPVSVTTTNFFRINNGGRYIHNTKASHTDLVSRLSTAAGTENGIFEFDIPATSPLSLSDRTYGTLVLSATANGGLVTYFANGISPLNINGDLIINTGVTFKNGLSADIIVHGNYNQASSSTFILQNSSNNNVVKLRSGASIGGIITKSNTGLPVLEFNGSSNQNISVTGTIMNDVTVRMNNSSGITLQTPMTLSYLLDLQNGNIKTDNTNILILTDNAVVTGATSSSFVEGPMKKIGDDNFTFPIGKGNIYAPIGFISSGMATTDAFQAEYLRLNPQTLYGVNYQSPPIHHISYVEYWKLDKVAGNTNIPAKITLTVTEYSFAKHMETLYVARYNPADVQWKSDNINSAISGPNVSPYVTGTITSTLLSSFGVFTIATSEAETENPLPLQLLSFDAVRLNDGRAKIEWLLAESYPNQALFALERSMNGNRFEAIASIQANLKDRSYTIYDTEFPGGKTSYRLKMIEEDGRFMYSNIVSLQMNTGTLEINIYPDPVMGNGSLLLRSSISKKIAIEILDATGKTIKQWQQEVVAGRTILPLQTGDLGRGIYFICVKQGSIKQVARFIKQ